MIENLNRVYMKKVVLLIALLFIVYADTKVYLKLATNQKKELWCELKTEKNKKIDKAQSKLIFCKLSTNWNFT